MWKCPVCGVLNEDREPVCSNCFSERKGDPAPQAPQARPVTPPVTPASPPVRPAAPPAYVPPAPPYKEKKAWPLVLAIIVVALILVGLVVLLIAQQSDDTKPSPRPTVTRSATTRPAATKTPTPKPTNTPSPTKMPITTVSTGNNTLYVRGTEIARVKFTATTAGTYVFTTTGTKDTYGYLYNSSTSNTELTSNDDGGTGSNFKIEYKLSANQTVYVGVKFYSANDTGNVVLNITRKTEDARTFELNSTVTSDKGRVTVRWTDSANKAPYYVLCQYVGSSGVTQPNYWAGGNKTESTTYSTSYTIDQLLPGKTYKIEVRDCDGNSITRTYTLPSPATFADDQLKASSIKLTLSPRSKRDSTSDSTATAVNSLSASKIVADMGQTEYGFRYSLDYPTLSHSRTHFTQIAIIAPNGYTECEVWENIDYEMQYTGKSWHMLGDWTFSMIYDKNRTVPSGTWTVELYWDGMFVNRSTFQVGN